MFTGSCLTNSFLAELFQGVHNFGSNGDTFMLALFDETASLTVFTAAYDPSLTGEISMLGYTQGGSPVPTQLGVASGGPVSFPQLLAVVWPAQLTARGGLIYNLTKGNRSVCVVDFANTYTSNPFTVTFPANGPDSAFLRIVGSNMGSS